MDGSAGFLRGKECVGVFSALCCSVGVSESTGYRWLLLTWGSLWVCSCPVFSTTEKTTSWPMAMWWNDALITAKSILMDNTAKAGTYTFTFQMYPHFHLALAKHKVRWFPSHQETSRCQRPENWHPYGGLEWEPTSQLGVIRNKTSALVYTLKILAIFSIERLLLCVSAWRGEH